MGARGTCTDSRLIWAMYFAFKAESGFSQALLILLIWNFNPITSCEIQLWPAWLGSWSDQFLFVLTVSHVIYYLDLGCHFRITSDKISTSITGTEDFPVTPLLCNGKLRLRAKLTNATWAHVWTFVSIFRVMVSSRCSLFCTFAHAFKLGLSAEAVLIWLDALHSRTVISVLLQLIISPRSSKDGIRNSSASPLTLRGLTMHRI